MFLRLEIYKKAIVSANLAVLIIWGIETYLYGLIVATLLGVSLNIYFAAREIQLLRRQFFKPLVGQALISVATVFVTLLLVEYLGEWHDFVLLLVKVVLFALIYFLINWWFNTNSFCALKEQLIPAFKKKLA